jgi:RNA polymerase sigma-70 factor (ECF subfamily)
MVELMDFERGTETVLERVDTACAVEAVDDTFEAIYRQRYRDVYRYVLLMLRSADEAEDATAEAFQRSYAAWNSGRRPSGQPLPWLLLIARRLVIDRMRRRKLVAWIPLARLSPAHEPRDGGGTGRTDFWLWFDKFARELPDRQREVLILRYQRDLDDEAIGEILGVSTSGVRSLVARACASLRSNPEIWR